MAKLISTLPKLRSTANYTHHSQDFETVSSLSETVPQQSLQLSTLLQRNAQGIPIPVHQGAYNETDTPDLDKMSKTDIAQYRIDLALDMLDNEQKYHEATKALEQLKNEEIEALKQAEIAKKQAENPPQQ